MSDDFVKLRALTDENGTLIPLKFVESISWLFGNTKENEVFDKLAGKLRFRCRTLSGEEYVLDIIENLKSIEDYDEDWSIDILKAIVVKSWFKAIEL